MLSAYDIQRGTVVEPRDAETAEVLGRRRWTPKRGVVAGICRGGDFVLVRWDGDACSVDDTVHWANLRPEGGEPYWRKHERG